MKLKFKDFVDHRNKIAVIGLGYVGLPLACSLGKKFKVIGYDIDEERVSELQNGIDRTCEVDNLNIENLTFTTNKYILAECSILIVTVPTPIDKQNNPDLRPIQSATKVISQNLLKGSIIVYESTVYPGVTENYCKKILELDGHYYNNTFFLGYSPERINPGDKVHTVDKIAKVVAGSTKETADLLKNIYLEVTKDIYIAPNIKTAEMAKVIENTQRDVNIALMNEISKACLAFGIKTKDVLNAAKTKWNFLDFEPGLVGGHCIGVDPYYLEYAMYAEGIQSRVISQSRSINDNMHRYIAHKIKDLKDNYSKKLIPNIAIYGMTFKENIPDYRNSKSIDLLRILSNIGNVFAVDNNLDKEKFFKETGIQIYNIKDLPKCHISVVAVKHSEYYENEFRNHLDEMESPRILVDLKNIYDPNFLKNSIYWSL